MNENANVKTQFKAYQLARMIKESSVPQIEKDNSKLEEFITKQREHMHDLPLNHENPVIRAASNKIRKSILEESKNIQSILDGEKAKDGPTKEFYRNAIAATIESLASDGVYPKNNTMFFAGQRQDDFEKGEYKKKIEVVLSECFKLHGLNDDAFTTVQYDENIGETLLQVSFPGFSRAREAIFDAVQKVGEIYNEHIYAVNGLGIDLTAASQNNASYSRALTSEGKAYSEGLYKERDVDFGPSIDEFIADKNDKFEKTYQKWEKTAFENKEQFDFGMVK